MANIILFDDESRNHLLPLTATRPVSELRVGIFTLREKWERLLHATASHITQEHLQPKWPIHIHDDNLIINAAILPTPELAQLIGRLDMHEALLHEGDLVAARLTDAQIEALIEDEELHELEAIDVPESVHFEKITRLWQLTALNGEALKSDFDLLTQGRQSAPISDTNRIVGDPALVFLEPGASIACCILNTTQGPIYLGANAEVMEGCMLRGPVAIGPDAIVKMGAKIYGPTTIGPGCRAGGEIARSILLANANKGHEGYLGDSVIGEWCNLGADTNNSNLKNNYAEVKLWNYELARFEPSGRQFVGLFMGDHAKCGINTMFNTGTVVGVFANVFGAGYPRNFVPDFAWGGPEGGYRTYRFDEACQTAETVLKRREQTLTEIDRAILKEVFDQTARHRNWEKHA